MTLLRRRWRRLAGHRGSVTAETAVVLPVLMVVLAIATSALGAGVTKMRCVDAARAAARELARDEAPDTARQVAARLAPGSAVRLSTHGDLVRVSVTAPVRVGIPGTGLGGWFHVSADVVARREPR